MRRGKSDKFVIIHKGSLCCGTGKKYTHFQRRWVAGANWDKIVLPQRESGTILCIPSNLFVQNEARTSY